MQSSAEALPKFNGVQLILAIQSHTHTPLFPFAFFSVSLAINFPLFFLTLHLVILGDSKRDAVGSVGFLGIFKELNNDIFENMFSKDSEKFHLRS